MCFTNMNFSGISNWNWEGDEMIHESIVPSARPIVGQSKDIQYNIDIREFLITEDNEVMKRTLNDDLKKFAAEHPKWIKLDLFNSRDKGSFDHRANVISAFIFEKIQYKKLPPRAPWLFPDETLTLGYGDCVDRAFLMASLLVTSGISPYNVRVALGKIIYNGEEFDHMWVMYKNEEGTWMLLDPLLHKDNISDKNPPRAINPSETKAEYSPSFLFNSDHLWAIRNPGRKSSFNKNVDDLRNAWKKFDPKFAGDVHYSILQEALSVDLSNKKPTPEVINFTNIISQYFHSILGNKIDDVDSPRPYNPLEHFDNGLIDDSWDLVNKSIAKFKTDHDPKTFSYLAHGIADFYAHSSYAHFVPRGPSASLPAPYLDRYSTASFQTWKNNILYDSAHGFDLTSTGFSINTHMWQGKISQRPGLWNGKLLSGRYAQINDSDRPTAGFFNIKEYIEKIGESSSEKDWDSASAINKNKNISCLPHHNEIAVDQLSKASWHVLYPDDNKYQEQFNLRKNTAVQHIRETFFNNW
jgi:hypothetical protein